MHDLRGVIALRELARQGSIAGAALALGYTASAVSQQLASLERDVAVPLIVRGPKSAHVNAAGLEFLDAAEGALDALAIARARASAAVGRLSGRVVVAAIPSVAQSVAGAVAHVRREEPLVDVVLVEASAPRAQRSLVEGAVDVAIVDDWGTRATALDSRLAMRTCVEEPIVLAARRDTIERLSRGATRRGIRPPADAEALAADLARALAPEAPLLCATEGNFSREFADAWLAAHGLSPRVRWEFDGLDTLAGLVAQGHGFAFLPSSVAAAHAHAGRVVTVALPNTPARAIACLWRPGPSPKQATVAQWSRILTAALESIGDPTSGPTLAPVEPQGHGERV